MGERDAQIETVVGEFGSVTYFMNASHVYL